MGQGVVPENVQGKPGELKKQADMNQVTPEGWIKDSGENFKVKLSGDCDKSPTWYNLGIFKDYEKGGYLENDQVETGVCRGGGISQRLKIRQAISNSHLETPAKATKLFGCENQDRIIQAIPS